MKLTRRQRLKFLQWLFFKFQKHTKKQKSSSGSPDACLVMAWYGGQFGSYRYSKLFNIVSLLNKTLLLKQTKQIKAYQSCLHFHWH